MLKFNLDDVARFAARVKRLDLTRGDVEPLLENWGRQLEEGNRKGVLAGLDKDGNAAPPLKYRPKGPSRKLTLEERLGQRPNLRRGRYGGLAPASGTLLANNNLSSSAYRQLDGPRLAPRKQFSRVITNAAPGHYPDVTHRGIWYVELAWGEVMSPKGVHFLKFHFNGEGQPPYDLRGIRPNDKEKMLKALRSWCMLTIRDKAFMGSGGV
jgi:hypothetical protein